MKRRHLAAALGAAVILPLLPLGVSPAGAVSAPEVVATGLNTPWKMTFGPDGGLYVAESGSAGDESCVSRTNPETGEEQQACYGATGSITRIGDGTVERVVTGLPSVGGEGEASGPVDVAFAPDGTMHVVGGLGGDEEYRDAFGDPRIGTVLKITEEGDEILSDLVAFEAENDPDADEPSSEGVDTNPFGIAFDGDDILAVDAGGNDVIRIAPDGTTTLEAVLSGGMAEAPPFIGAPPGTMIPYQSVPTAIDIHPDGTPIVGQLTGFPFPVGEADVLAVEDGTVSVYEEGFTNVLDVDIAADGTMYVLEFADNGLLSEMPAPALVEVRPDGTRKYLLYGDELPAPGGVEVGPDGMVYVSVCTLCGPGNGMVWKLDPTVARDAAIADLCPPASYPGTGIPDIKGTVHREAIECLVALDVIAGYGDGTFGPNDPVTRAQAASLVARALQLAGVPLDSSEDAFPDDDGSVHEDNINALAAYGIVTGRADGTYGPNQRVTRGQLASMFARAWEAATGEPLAPGQDVFGDDDGSVHEDNINAVAAAGWVLGVGEGTFAPNADATRGQFASMLARMLNDLLDTPEPEPSE